MAKKASTKVKQSEATRNGISWVKVGLMTLSVLLIMVTSLTVWLKNNVYNTPYFSKTLVTTIKQEDTRNAIAGELTDQLYAKRPVLQRVLTQPTESIISSLLSNDKFDNVLYKVSSNVSQRVTLGHTQAITVDISGFSNGITAIQQAVAPDAKLSLPTGEAAKLTIVKANTLPNLHKPGQLLMILNPFLLLGLLAMLIVTFFTASSKMIWLKDFGIVLVISSAILLTLSYSISSYLSTFAQDQNQQIIIQNIFTAFTQRFQTFQTWLLVLGAAAIACSATIRNYTWPATIWHRTKSAFAKK